MIDQPAYIKILLQKYIYGNASAVEHTRLMAAWDIYDDDELAAMIAEITGTDNSNESEEVNSETPAKETATGKKTMFPEIKESLLNNAGLGAMVLFSSFIITGCFLVWLFSKQESTQLPLPCNGVPGNTELPTSPYHCRLVLANDSSLVISSSYTSKSVNDTDVEITQPEAGLLVFKHIDKFQKEGAVTKYHTVITTGGQQYRLVLPDGSKVRLNAASSISFPVGFNHQQRKVYLKGEAFFEVVKSKLPFVVEAGLTQLEIQQASFNIDAYSRNTVTTITNGSLQVKSSAQIASLIAGEKTTARVKILVAKDELSLTDEDSTAAVSWKKVTRVYTNTPMREFVADIGRRYNLEIINITCIPAGGRITTSLCHNAELDDVLAIFKKTGLKFYHVGKRLTFCDPTLKPQPALNDSLFHSIDHSNFVMHQKIVHQ